MALLPLHPFDRIPSRRPLPNVGRPMLRTTIPVGPIQQEGPNLLQGWVEYVNPNGERYWVKVSWRLVTVVDPRSHYITHVNAAYLELSARHRFPQDHMEVYIGFDGEDTPYYIVDHSVRMVLFNENWLATWPESQYWAHLEQFPNHQLPNPDAEDMIIGNLLLGAAEDNFPVEKAGDMVNTLLGLQKAPRNSNLNAYRVSTFARVWSQWSAREVATRGRRVVTDTVVVVPAHPRPQPKNRLRDLMSVFRAILLYLAKMAEVIAMHIGTAEGAWTCLPIVLSIICAYAAYTSDRLTWAALVPLTAAFVVWIVLGRDRRMGTDLANVVLLTIVLINQVDSFHNPGPSVGLWASMGICIILPLVVRFTLKFRANDPGRREV